MNIDKILPNNSSPLNEPSHNYIKSGRKRKKESVKRISISLSTKLLSEFDKSMVNAGYIDRSKDLQTAMYFFINSYEWDNGNNESLGAGAIIMLYDNHIYDQDEKSTQIQHQFQDIISATTHIHLDKNNCLETIMVKGNIKKTKEII